MFFYLNFENDVDHNVYKRKVLLIVKVASKCGLTNSNYTELNQLYEKYKDQGLNFELLLFFDAYHFEDR
ncbi:putative glutathione peroxidase [Rosa chinensis]|uniref:Putative glutathione peroxidase n=1 Tax=Rosa chinensis TaxID=74649 RepID=A0A2P6PJB5_ROSCH|nr:putative glutathione peroxidase [Rosa chinensis]